MRIFGQLVSLPYVTTHADATITLLTLPKCCSQAAGLRLLGGYIWLAISAKPLHLCKAAFPIASFYSDATIGLTLHEIFFSSFTPHCVQQYAICIVKRVKTFH